MLKHHINWGILGTSFISNTMAEAIAQSDHGTLIAVGSRQQNSADEFVQKNSAMRERLPRRPDGLLAMTGTTYQGVLDNPDVDVVYIGLPNHLHKEWIIRAANAGKHILCEKPLVVNVKELHEVEACLAATRVFCMEGLMYRHHPFTKKLHELVTSGILGKIKLFHTAYTADISAKANTTCGGSIRNLGCYPVSLIRLLMNAEPTELRAMGRLNTTTRNDRQASLMMKFPDETLAIVSTADDMQMFWQFDIYGTEGSLKVITNPWLPETTANKILIQRNDENTTQVVEVAADKELFVYQANLMNTAIMNQAFNHQTVISLADSRGNVAVLEEWMRQISEGVTA